MSPTSCCHCPVLLLWFCPCWVALPNRLVTSEQVLPRASKEKDASSCMRAHHTHPMSLGHFGDVIAPASMPWGQWFTDLHMARLKGTSDRQDVFSCMSFHPSYGDCIISRLTPQHSAYGTWGIICQFSDTARLFSLCKFLFTCPFVSDVRFLALGFGLCWTVCMSTSIDRGWRHNGVMAWLWDGKKERQGRGETERCRVEDRSSPAGGSPQATSDIPLSDGLMRLPWHFFPSNLNCITTRILC